MLAKTKNYQAPATTSAVGIYGRRPVLMPRRSKEPPIERVGGAVRGAGAVTPA